MRVVLVANTASGAFGPDLTPGALAARLTAAGLDLAPEPAPDAPLPERLAAAAGLPGIAALVVAGGDGTLACAAQALVEQGLAEGARDLGRANRVPAACPVALGLLPLGTMNLLARDLGIPLDLDGAVACIAAGQTRTVDVGSVNGHVFLINSVLGMAARMQRHREARRGRMGLSGLARFGLALLRHLGRFPRLSLRLPGRPAAVRIRLAAVVVGDYAEEPGRILSRAGVDGGRLTLYVVRRLSPLRLLRLGFGFAIGEWRTMPGLERHEGRRFSVGGRRRALRVMNDGEIRLIAPPLRYRLHPRALAVLVPGPPA